MKGWFYRYKKLLFFEGMEDKMIKKKLCRLIFKKELNEEYKMLNNNYKRELSHIKSVLNENEKRYGLIKRIFHLFPNAEIVGLERNKNDEELIVVINDNTIYLFGEKYQDINGLPRIYFEIKEEEYEFVLKKKYIHIVDVLMEDDDIGNGTIAMNNLIKYAKKNKIKYIDGTLSSVDDDHADRRNHFYKKFGFVISDSDIKLEF